MATAAKTRDKVPYHHGELRQALIDATRKLVRERGEENFSLADACRAAGVSTAAPYRHFADKGEILAEVVAQGFDDMYSRSRQAASHFPAGDPRRIVAIGRVYLEFAISEPSIFRLMFGQQPDILNSEKVTDHGKECFGYVIKEVSDYCSHQQIAGDAELIATQLWSLVHGISSLTIDGNYKKVVPSVNIEEMMSSAAERLLFSRGRK